MTTYRRAEVVTLGDARLDLGPAAGTAVDVRLRYRPAANGRLVNPSALAALGPALRPRDPSPEAAARLVADAFVRAVAPVWVEVRVRPAGAGVAHEAVARRFASDAARAEFPLDVAGLTP